MRERCSKVDSSSGHRIEKLMVGSAACYPFFYPIFCMSSRSSEMGGDLWLDVQEIARKAMSFHDLISECPDAAERNNRDKTSEPTFILAIVTTI